MHGVTVTVLTFLTGRKHTLGDVVGDGGDREETGEETEIKNM